MKRQPVSSHHLLDPELAAGLAGLPPFETISAESLPEIRAMMNRQAAELVENTPREGIDVFECVVPPQGDGGEAVRVLVYAPSHAPAPMPAYLHVHGGGFVSGKPEIRHASSVHLSQALGCVVVSVDYRLAPEHPFPAAVEDCYTALKWLFDNSSSLGIDKQRIAIGGESAGGGLAAALALLVRDRGEIAICFQMLIYPMLDHRTAKDGDAHPYSGQFVWNRDNNRFGWDSLLGEDRAAKDISPYASAATASALEGLPPSYLAVGALDLFAEENLDYARRLMRAGVPTELHLYPGAFHAFDLVAEARVTQEFRRDWHGALRRAFEIPSLNDSVKRG